MNLDDLATLLETYSDGRLDLEAIHARLLPVLTADPLDVEASDSAPWDHAHAETRLFWRVVYLFESESVDSDAVRTRARRIVGCLHRTRSAELTFELLPLILDQDRFAVIVSRHRSGIISRTGLLSVIAESGYPSHVKLWLAHAGAETLTRLAEWLTDEHYEAVAAAFDAPPA